MDLWTLFGEQQILAKETFMNSYQLIDLNQVENEQLEHYLWFGSMALMLKHVHDSDILPFFKRYLILLRALEKTGEGDYIYTILSYVVEAGEVSNAEEFLHTIKQLESFHEDKVMTIAEQFRQEGFLKGIEKGIEKGRDEGVLAGMEKGKLEGKLEIARSMLAKGMDIELISSLINLDLKAIEKLKN